MRPKTGPRKVPKLTGMPAAMTERLSADARAERRSPSPWRNAPGQRKERNLAEVRPTVIGAQPAVGAGDEVLMAWFVNLRRRNAMADENVLDTRPKGTFTAIFTPPWWVDMAAAKNGSILQVHHPEHGWLAFVFPPEHAAMLGAALVEAGGAV